MGQIKKPIAGTVTLQRDCRTAEQRLDCRRSGRRCQFSEKPPPYTVLTASFGSDVPVHCGANQADLGLDSYDHGR